MQIFLDQKILTESKNISAQKLKENQESYSTNRVNYSCQWTIFTWGSKGKLTGEKEKSRFKKNYMIFMLRDYTKNHSRIPQKDKPPIIFSDRQIDLPDHAIEIWGGSNRNIPIDISEPDSLIKKLEEGEMKCLLHSISRGGIFQQTYHCAEKIKEMYQESIKRNRNLPMYQKSYA